MRYSRSAGEQCSWSKKLKHEAEFFERVLPNKKNKELTETTAASATAKIYFCEILLNETPSKKNWSNELEKEAKMRAILMEDLN